MEIRRLPADEAAVRRYVEELWLPYHRHLEATVDAHALADDIDLVAEETEFRLDLLETESHRTWIAVDGTDSDGSRGGLDGELAGFVATDVDESPVVFDRPDRLVVGDIYVRGPYRGRGIARELLSRAAKRARETGCSELTLDVDADNEHARSVYETLGFETRRRQMTVAAEEL
ncbi:GNAT family N-acetyltransferase [Halopelagius longus]|uniref:Acetyltransferase (GNAT) family protein n=1 Tax=Halopelagius longus TaxID=1236180 RepID=A0A1H1G140_9EURY|nr:GNAT family N-acetyltransferase [Halopelagius longus]RDI69910.1 GNAT family N-acetyltransferase [Halopelagius longus]SDR06843.1 Acetyltransferase (GNAT) family protein [Halopelagius longus]